MTDLIEDEDGAPLPPPLQRDGAGWRVLNEFIADSTLAITQQEVTLATDLLAIRLAPALFGENA